MGFVVSWLTVLPPLIAIAFVLWRKEVIGALLIALFCSEFLILALGDGVSLISPLLHTGDRLVSVFQSEGNTRILIFSLLIGALLAYVRQSGGVSATVELLVNKNVINSPRKAGLMPMLTGTIIFVESNLSILTSGIISRGVFDRFKMSRARLAYIIDSTSAPICILILLNGWGAYVLALLEGYELGQSSVSILWGSTLFNFYALVTLAIVVYTVLSNRVHGPLKTLEQNATQNIQQDNPLETITPASKARFMILPIATMILGMIAFMFITGNGNLAEGSGSKSVLYGTICAVLVAYFMMLLSGRFQHKDLVNIGFNGMSDLLPLVSIVLLSLALGSSLKLLGTGQFIAGVVSDHIPAILIAPLLFITGAIISFTTGTSWGTFAILIPLGMPLAGPLQLDPSLVLGAILGGGIFGDHCSPISDTTAVSALASGSGILEHVETQLPYALTAGGIAIGLYFVAGFI